MTKAVFVCLLVVVSTACSSSEPDKKTKVRNHMKKLADKLCSCDTFGCAKTVFVDLVEHAEENYPLSKDASDLRRGAVKCFNKVAPPTERVGDGSTEADVMAKFSAELCACADPPCAKAVKQKLTAWILKIGKRKKSHETKAALAVAAREKSVIEEGNYEAIMRWSAAQKMWKACYARILKASNSTPAP